MCTLRNIFTKWIVKNLILIFLISAVAGCSNTMIKPDAFGKSKTYALVTVIYNPDINYFGSGKGFSMGGQTTVSGLIKSAGKNNGYSKDATEIFTQTYPKIVKSFQATKSFRLMAENKVLQNPAYKKAKGSEPTVLWTHFGMPTGYKYFDDEEVLKKLANDLHVDGVITMYVSYGYTFNGVSAFGLVSAGTEHGAVMISLAAINKEGEKVWKDLFLEESAESVGAVGESADFDKIYPLIKDAANRSIGGILETLDKITQS